jgi:hypothetical protein
MTVARQQSPKTHQWEQVFSMQSVRQLCEAKIEELMRDVFSVRSVPRCYKQNKSEI